MSKDIKKCKICGRIITDKNNVTGLCPKHQKGLLEYPSCISGSCFNDF